MQWILLILGFGSIASFHYLIYLKVKLYTRRMTLKEIGTIKSQANLAVLAVFEVVIWIVPVFFFRKVNDPENMRLIRRADMALLLTISFGIILILGS